MQDVAGHAAELIIAFACLLVAIAIILLIVRLMGVVSAIEESIRKRG